MVDSSAPAPPAAALPALDRRWVVALIVAMLGVAAGWFGPIQILLPAQSARLAADGLGGGLGKEAILAIVTGYGAVASMVANPLWGVLSDRGLGRLGRRKPVIVLGLAVAVAGLLLLAAAADPLGMLIGWVLVQIGLNGPLAALAAMIADRVPEPRRGLVGSLFGVAQIAGVVLGSAVAVALGEGAIGYVALAVVVPALTVAILILPPPPAVDTAPAAVPGLRAVLGSIRITRPFALVWTIRFALNLVNAMMLLYLYFYLADGVGVDDPGTWVLLLTLGSVLITGGVAAAGGAISDRLGRRRVFIVVGAAVLAIAAAVMALAPTVPGVVVATALVGVGWGLYIAIDLAVVTAVLPSGESNATMLGVANIASALPQVLAPVIAAPIVTAVGGYPALYLLTAGVAVAAIAVVPALRGIR